MSSKTYVFTSTHCNCKYCQRFVLLGTVSNGFSNDLDLRTEMWNAYSFSLSAAIERVVGEFFVLEQGCSFAQFPGSF